MGLIAFGRGKAIYAQIAEILEEEIRSNYRSGAALPSEEHLTMRFGVNRHTLRRAIDELVLSGLVERRHGVGLFVLYNSIEYKLGHRSRFTQALTDLGHSAETRIIRKAVVPASEKTALRLGVKPGQDVVWVETLREVDGWPFCLISHFLPHHRFAGVVERFMSGSLHSFLETDFTVRLKRSNSLISTTLPKGDDARLLAIGKYQPILRVKSMNADQASNEPVECKRQAEAVQAT